MAWLIGDESERWCWERTSVFFLFIPVTEPLAKRSYHAFFVYILHKYKSDINYYLKFCQLNAANQAHLTTLREEIKF